MTQQGLIDDLIARTEQLMATAQEYRTVDEKVLNTRPAQDSWSVLECLEHLNLYGDFYLREIEERILHGKPVVGNPRFKSGWFGERTVTSMLPKEGMFTMNAFKNMTPDPSLLSRATVDRFIRQQEVMLTLLDKARHIDLRRTTTRITLPVIRFYLGTTLRFVIYHNERHMWQAQRALVQAESLTR